MRMIMHCWLVIEPASGAPCRPCRTRPHHLVSGRTCTQQKERQPSHEMVGRPTEPQDQDRNGRLLLTNNSTQRRRSMIAKPSPKLVLGPIATSTQDLPS